MSQWLKSLFSFAKQPSTKYISSNYDQFTRLQLIEKIRTLENQLKKNIPTITDKIHQQSKRPFDISQYGQRRIALKVAYMGWNYSGFATQGDEIATPTVEGQLFRALESCRLIVDSDHCQFTRCGRTDKGVSGLGQVIALNVRSHKKKIHTELINDPKEDENQLAYIEILNRLLPDDIRILAWAPVSPEFNARFDCKSRTYKYFFQKGELDLSLMKKAASYMIGNHDFRNFCRLDPSKNITNYHRDILSLEITSVGGEGNFYQVKLRGTAFLWHQVRCIMSILFLVGQKLEEPEIVMDLLNVAKVPAKPDYPMASGLPLMLYDCEFENLHWMHHYHCDATSSKVVIPTPVKTYRHFHELWATHHTKGLLYQNSLEEVAKTFSSDKGDQKNQATILLGGGKVIRTNRYKKLLDRQRADSDQVKKEKYQLKKKAKSNN